MDFLLIDIFNNFISNFVYIYIYIFKELGWGGGRGDHYTKQLQKE